MGKLCSNLLLFLLSFCNLCLVKGHVRNGAKNSLWRNSSHFYTTEMRHLDNKLLYSGDIHGNYWGTSLFALTSLILEKEFSAKKHCSCLIVVSEGNEDGIWTERNVIQLASLYIPVVNIEISSEDIQFNTSYFESLLTNALNQGCSCFLIRVSDGIPFMNAISKARKNAEQRHTEKYLILIPLLSVKCGKDNLTTSMTNTSFSAYDSVTEKGNENYERENTEWKTQKSQEIHGVSDLTDIFKMKEINFYPNILVIQKSFGPSESEGSFSILTHVYGHNQSNGNNVRELNKWNGTDFSGVCYNISSKAKKKMSCFFPDKLSDMNGEPIVFATFNYPPYSVLEYSISGVKRKFVDGIEIRIAALLGQRLNFTWSLYVDAEHFWGEIWDNSSGNGILGAISSGKADLGFGAIYLWEYEHHFVDYSMPYVRTGITVLAPRPCPLPEWITPLLPFSKSLWVAVILGVFVSALALYTLARIHISINLSEVHYTRYCDPTECLLRAVGLLALAPDPTPPPDSQTGLRQLLLVWLPVWGLLLATAYSAGLSSALAIPHSQAPIDTISQLAKSNILWAAPHPAWAFSIRGATDPILKTLFNNFKVMSEAELHARSFGRSIAYAVERLPAGNFAIGSYLQGNGSAIEHLRLMHEDIYYEYVVTALQKSSPLRSPLDFLVGRLHESGIPLYWEGAMSRKFPIKGANVVGLKTSTRAPTALTLHILQGPFYLLFIGLILSLLVFIGEHVWKPTT